MPRARFSLVFSPIAKQDIKEIQLYTLENWGEKQCDKYEAIINDGLNKLAIFPEAGRKLSDTSQEHRAYKIGNHFAIYQIVGNEIRVSRILHESMEFGQHYVM